MGIPVSHIMIGTGLSLVLLGMAGMLMHRNILRIIIGFCLIDTGLHITMVATGYVTGGTAPIVEKISSASNAATVDPIPAALVVTAIVIGFSVTAVMLAFAIRLYDVQKTLSIDALTESRW